MHEEYAERIDKGNQSMVWGAASVHTWYKSESGRVSQNWPFSLLEFWQRTRGPKPDVYELVGAGPG